MNVIFMQPLHQSFQSVTNSLCGETVNASRPDLIQKLILIRAKKGGAWGLSWTLFEQSHYVALLHWLTSFENSNQGGIQPLSTAKLLKWPKIQTLSLSETRSLPVYCVLQLSHGLALSLSLSANIKCCSSTHNLTWDLTNNQRIDRHKSDLRPPSHFD